jgi:hypothetical protein
VELCGPLLSLRECYPNMKTFDSHLDKTIVQSEARKRSEVDQYWQTAGDRVLLYLRCLNFPAPKALDLALRALKTAEQSVALGSGKSPVVETMQALHQLLSQSTLGKNDRTHSLATWCGWLVSPSPSLYRLPMVPEGMASAQWRFLLTRLLNRFR